jgi:acetyltransferase
VSLGDAADVDAADVLDYLGSDPATRAVLLYIESVGTGRKFLSAARAAARSKPVIVMKSGRTPAGAETALRHTGAHAGDDDAFDAAVARSGMLRVNSIGALFDAAETLARMPDRALLDLTIVTNAGGPAVVAADALTALGGRLAGTPVDLGGDATAPRYAEALRSTLAGSDQHAVLLIHGPSGVVSAETIAETCRDEARNSGRVLGCWMGGEHARRGAGVLREARVPVYDTPEAAVQAFVHRVHYRHNQEALQEAPEWAVPGFTPDEPAAQTLLAQVLAAGRERLTDPEGKALLTAYGVPVVHTHVATSADEAARLAAEIGYPVALKVLAPDLEHRADIGGVMLNLENEEELRGAARDITQRLQAYKTAAQLAGFTVQRMIRPPGAVHRRHGADELLLCAAADRVFGRLIRLGKAVGLVPLNAALAMDMLEPNARGAPAVALVLERVSQLVAHHPELVELEIDPLLVDERGAMALEVRARIARAAGRPGEHLAIRPYPRELEQRLDLPDLNAVLRPIRPEDARAYAEFIARTDAPDMRFRFFTRVRRVSTQDLARYTQIDYDREMAFVAVTARNGAASEILGEVRIMTYPDGETAEFALLVRSDVKRRGLGRALIQKVIDYCRGRGKRILIGQMLPDNEAMAALARASGMEIELAPDANLTIAHLELQPRAPEVRLF